VVLPQPRHLPPVQPPQQRHGTITVTDVGACHVHGQQPKGVDQQVPLAAVEPLGAVVAVRPPFSDLAA
jgi:hypothetical protein